MNIKRIRVTVTTQGDKEEDIFDRELIGETECTSRFGTYEITSGEIVNKFLSGEFEFLIQGKIEELENQPFETIKEIKE